MKITQNDMAMMFEDLNRTYFDGELKTPKFIVTHTLDAMGLFHRRGNDIEIRMSDVYDRELKSYKNTMLHEMIHLKLDQNGIEEKEQHGKNFMREAKRLNEFGWNITPLCDTSNEKINEGTTRKRTVYVFFDKKGYMAVAAERGGERLVELNLRSSGVRQVRKIVTDDPMFALLPSCRNSIVGIRLSDEQIEYCDNKFFIKI